MPNGAWWTNERGHGISGVVGCGIYVCVCISKTHGELVVDFVDVLVDPAVVEKSVEEVVPRVFHHGAAEALSHDVRPTRTHAHQRWNHFGSFISFFFFFSGFSF